MDKKRHTTPTKCTYVDFNNGSNVVQHVLCIIECVSLIQVEVIEEINNGVFCKGHSPKNVVGL